MSVSVNTFFHQDTGTASYLVVDSSGKKGVIIDSVLDLDIASGQVNASIANAQLDFAKQHEVDIQWVLDTHAHADHLSAASYIKNKTKASTAIGEGILDVQQHFSKVFSHKPSSAYGQNGFDRLLKDRELLSFGESEIEVLATPGHTDDSVSYVIENNIFVGDTLFMPDGGTARCDFPGGNANKLWTSIQRIYQLPDETSIWVCHDYQPGGRELLLHTTVAESKARNIHVNQNIQEANFVEMRNERDAGLAVPRLLYPSLQVNLWGAGLPDADKNGIRHLCIPLTVNC